MNEGLHQSSRDEEEDETKKLRICCLFMPMRNIIWQTFALYGTLFASAALLIIFITNRFERQLTLHLHMSFTVPLLGHVSEVIDFRRTCSKQEPISQKCRS